MENHDALQIAFSVSSREQRRAGRRMWRYRAPDLKRRYWLATLLLVVIFAALFYGFSENVRRVTNFLWDGYELFQESGQTDETLPEWGRDIWLGNTDAMEVLADRTFVAGDFLFALELFPDAAGIVGSAGRARAFVSHFCRGFIGSGSGAHAPVLCVAGGVARHFGC